MYTARKGKGAFCNGNLIKVSGQKGDSVLHMIGTVVANQSTRWSWTSAVDPVCFRNEWISFCFLF